MFARAAATLVVVRLAVGSQVDQDYFAITLGVHTDRRILLVTRSQDHFRIGRGECLIGLVGGNENHSDQEEET